MPPNTPLLPPWIALPAAGFAMLFIAGHVLVMYRADIPPSRRRIRVAAGLLMMVVAGLLGYGFGVVTPAQSAMFVLTWLAIVGMLVIVVTVAMIDVINNLRLHAEDRRALRRAMARPIGAPPAGGDRDHGERSADDEQA
jgi:peptidoglycan/LPS O-acetylase OafA/YrhL